MVLFVGGRAIAVSMQLSGLSALMQNDTLAAAAREFCKKAPEPIGTAGLLAVEQQERATVTHAPGAAAVAGPQHNAIRLLGSDEATTCMILFVQSIAADTIRQLKTTVAHVDSGEMSPELFQDFTEAERAAGLRVWMVGSYADAKKHSVTLASEICDFLHAATVPFHVELACILQHNTLSSGQPFTRGAVFDLSTQTVRAARLTDRGPLLILRGARLWSGEAHLAKVFDQETDEIVVNAFHYIAPKNAQKLATMSDSYILSRFSTSPDTESDRFGDEMRGKFKFFAENPDYWKVFPGGQAVRAPRTKNTVTS
eukprot:TRINITY_DN6683_c0_g1_i1.p1 TRINITY_DN6683_c0_g1~~TRINITY_DN6683_c0_g1_i1.p1  ORF type:complete len:335 (+),score=64.95 TRINITY_DN6683_c0_g1_i1:70-1005(+)